MKKIHFSSMTRNHQEAESAHYLRYLRDVSVVSDVPVRFDWREDLESRSFADRGCDA